MSDSIAAPVSFRPWGPGDVAALLRHANNPKVALNMKDRFPHPYTAADAESWIALNLAGHPTFTSFAIDVEGEAIGGVLAELGEDVYRKSAEISYWIAEPFWGRKIATRAARFIAEHAFAHHPIDRLSALVFEWNAPSRRVLEKAGFRLEGQLRRAITKWDQTGDLYIYGRLRGEPGGEAAPAPLR